MNIEENNELSKEEVDIEMDKLEKYLIKRGAIHKHLLFTRMLVDKINKLGYNTDLTKEGITEVLNIKSKDLDLISYSCNWCRFCE
ncbi:hypothetical protein [Maribacter sp. 4G9]|uniref:hypothetical protein n=1 Tax=Maribacter sp. 4G9 TaxID=1889777 RepID=UPI000C158096|nr:hypothetical protein [Maribacter sp. 4G9]PIB31233.1 hypothetical protein BFP75_01615 [Maribacter sp. 4G9]